MVETYKRKRTKSTSRKRRSRSSSASKPIILSREKISTQSDVKDKDSDIEEIHVVKRVTRQTQSRIAELEMRQCKVSIEREVPIVKKTKDKKKILNETLSNETCVEMFCNFILHISILGLIPIVILLNKMCESGDNFEYLNISYIKYFYNWQYLLFITSWLIILGVLAHIPVGTKISSTTKDGISLNYRCNGILSLIISTIVLISLTYTKHFNTKMVYNNYYFLIGSSTMVALILSYIILIKSYCNKQLKISLHPGNLMKRFMMGWEINPRILGLDLKLFYDFRPGYIGWALLNIVFCIKDLEDNNYKSINLSLLLSAFGQIFYCFDALIFENDIISKPFLIEGRFGFFHCFGNQVIMPFIFTLTTRAIQINKFQLPMQCLAGIFLLNIIGYIIYRASNIQKNSFRQNPYSVHLCHLKTLTNHRGHQVLVGGWWGFLRHPNYLGDIMMNLSWSLSAGLHLNVCWFFPIFFIIVIVIRCIRDDRKCSLEHGSTWNEYRKCVPYRLIPFVF